MNLNQILEHFGECKNDDAIKGMARFVIKPENSFGLTIPFLRDLASKIGKEHSLALELWESAIR
ncbi:MAG: DNA alkylation repair protein [Deltaproteobacteria bacterium]|nr:DNA alkylation repair protein [Deltaproteobacteria bacterium]